MNMHLQKEACFVTHTFQHKQTAGKQGTLSTAMWKTRRFRWWPLWCTLHRDLLDTALAAKITILLCCRSPWECRFRGVAVSVARSRRRRPLDVVGVGGKPLLRVTGCPR